LRLVTLYCVRAPEYRVRPGDCVNVNPVKCVRAPEYRVNPGDRFNMYPVNTPLGDVGRVHSSTTYVVPTSTLVGAFTPAGTDTFTTVSVS